METKEKKQIPEEEIVTSHSEEKILKHCLGLMEQLTREFQEWYEMIHGEDALNELDEEELFGCSFSYFEIVQKLFLFSTGHSGGNSTRTKCEQLGVNSWENITFGFEREES